VDVPGIIALLLLLVFTFLHRQSHDPYFRAWQLGWTAYCAHFAFLAWNVLGHRSPVTQWASDFTFVLMAWCVFRSTRLLRQKGPLHWSDAAILGAGAVWSVIDAFASPAREAATGYTLGVFWFPRPQVVMGIAMLLAVSAARF